MKILITTDSYYPMLNGVTVSTETLYRQLKGNGNEVKILTLSNGTKDYVENDIYYLSSIHINIYPEAKIARLSKSGIIREILEWRPDIIHSQTEFSTYIITKYIKRKLSVPHVHTYHTMYEDYLKYVFSGRFIKKKHMHFLTRALLKSVDTVIVPTKKIEKLLVSYKIPESRIGIIPTGIDTKTFHQGIPSNEKKEMLEQYGIQEDDFVLIYVGRIAEEKNIMEIIHLFKDAKHKIDKLKLLVVGGGPYLDFVKKAVKDLDMDDCIKFTGMIDKPSVPKYYKLGEVFLTASRSETQGLTYLEALASGRIILCRWDPCIENIITNGKTGFTYSTDEDFHTHLANIVHDTSLREQIKKNAIKAADLFSQEKFGHDIELIYESLLMRETSK